VAPPIRYVRNADGLNIAYYTLGSGPPLISISPALSHAIEPEWDIPIYQSIWGLSSQAFTVVRFDPHGCGLSDRNDDDLSLDSFINDLEAVADAVAPDTFALWAPGALSPVGIAYAARHPERVSHLMLWMTAPRGADTRSEVLERVGKLAMIDWKLAAETIVRALDNWEHDELAMQHVEMMVDAVTPQTMIKFDETRLSWDVTELLPLVQAKTLIFHPKNHRYFKPDGAKLAARTIPNARLVMLDSASVLFPDLGIAAETGEFLGIDTRRRDPRPDTRGRTAIILFADIVSSTALTERLGDAVFRERSRAIDAAIREAVRAAGGTPVEGKVMGDGVMSTFASARQAIDAALRCREASAQHELPLHLGIHAGDVIREADNVYGGAVNIAARICDASAPGEILVSEIVRGLARTSAGVSFEDRGERALKGIDEPQRLWAVLPQT
jgi:class 3 adenylate cyclase